jgi:hypothetical protein
LVIDGEVWPPATCARAEEILRRQHMAHLVDTFTPCCSYLPEQ